MSIRSKLAASASRATSTALRKLGRGGTTLPGRVALAINPAVLGELAEGLHVTVVTGTNGKTTTSRMIEQAFKDAGYAYFANKSGANLLPGITAIFAQHAGKKNADGKPYTHALIECDEAAFRKVSEFLPVECLVVGNIFRDQLDRFGEISHTLEAIRTGISNIPDATLCLDADCSLTTSLAYTEASGTEPVPNPVTYFGVDVPIYKQPAKELSDAPYCIRCKNKYEYSYHTLGHLGGYACPNCGYARPEPAVSVTAVTRTGADDSDVVMQINGQTHDVHINIPGGYNVYNAAGALAACEIVGIPTATTLDALAHFEVGFGRAEQFSIGNTKARLMLVKNPAGYNQVINLIAGGTDTYQLAFLLNDRFADGTDISWIWDTDFELLASQADRFSRILVSGIRAEDMALRLKYAGFDPERIEMFPADDGYAALLDALGETETPSFLMPTYTAMFDLREAIAKRTDLKAFYE